MYYLRLNNAWTIQHDLITSICSLRWGVGLLWYRTTRWQCCSIPELVLTCWLFQETAKGIEGRRKTESKTESRRRFLALYVAPSCSLVARRHRTLPLFVPTTPKVNDFTHYRKWCLVFTLSHRSNEYSRPSLFSGCPEVRLYVNICPKTDSKQSSEWDVAKTSMMMFYLDWLVCMLPACVCASKAADTFLFTWPHLQ